MTPAALTVSLNEIGFFAARAAVGVGVPFGLAEDFAGALRRLPCFGLDPAVVGLSCLTALDADPSLGRIGISKRGDRYAIRGNGPASAVYVGPSMIDCLRAAPDSPVLARSVDRPALALGYAVGGPPMRIAWPGFCADLGGDGVARISTDAPETLSASGPADVVLSAPVGSPSVPFGPRAAEVDIASATERSAALGVTVDAAAWSGLMELFRRCLVPSSERSRASGAGAGLVDAD